MKLAQGVALLLVLVCLRAEAMTTLTVRFFDLHPMGVVGETAFHYCEEEFSGTGYDTQSRVEQIQGALLEGEFLKVVCVSRAMPFPEVAGTGVPILPFTLDTQGNLCSDEVCTWVPVIDEDGRAISDVVRFENGLPYGAGVVEEFVELYETTVGVRRLSFGVDDLPVGYHAFFVVVMDTRAWDGAERVSCPAEPKRITRYGVGYAETFHRSSNAPIPPKEVTVYLDFEGAPGWGEPIYGTLSPRRPTARVSTLVLNGVSLEGAALEAALSPSFVSSDAPLTLLPTSPDVMLYTLETATAVQGPWEKVSAWSGELRYDRIRADGKTPLALPYLSTEKSRFYRLVAPGGR